MRKFKSKDYTVKAQSFPDDIWEVRFGEYFRFKLPDHVFRAFFEPVDLPTYTEEEYAANMEAFTAGLNCSTGITADLLAALATCQKGLESLLPWERDRDDGFVNVLIAMKDVIQAAIAGAEKEPKAHVPSEKNVPSPELVLDLEMFVDPACKLKHTLQAGINTAYEILNEAKRHKELLKAVQRMKDQAEECST